jgi:hypothetical protein
MRRLRSLLVIALFFTHSLYARPVMRVYILAGQSNMDGTYNPLISQLPAGLTGTIPDVLIKVNGDVNIDWGPLRPGLGATANNFGPEITFGRDALASSNGDKIAIIKFAYGGTTLNEDWRPPSSGGTVGWLYTALINDITTGLAALDSTYSVEIMGVCWMQGEYDALDATKASNYEVNLGNFIHDIRAAFNNPQLPFVIGMIDSSVGWTYNAIVRQGEINVAKNISGLSIFDTHRLGTDGYHYNTSGQIELGHFFYYYLANPNVCIQCEGNTVTVFPNPSNGYFKITYTEIPTDYTYKITDVKGAIIRTGQLYIGCEVDVSALSPGTYFISLTTNETTVVKKLIKI